jgi:peptidoglycan/xylan/chitin deacetylase (PgdA/CDA1 family)
VQPISRLFGFDRGTPIDRYYIEKFLACNRSAIHGHVLEIADNTYTKKYGGQTVKSDVLNVVDTSGTTIVGNLATGVNIPESTFDCIIMTQTIQFIYEVKSALHHAVRSLKPGGTLLLTAAGISQISRYDMDRWGEYWRFTDKSLKMLLSECLPAEDIQVEAHGNVAVAKAFLDGLAWHELPQKTLEYKDNDYQILLTARATKPLKKTTARSVGIRKPRKQDKIQAPMVLLYHRVWDDPINAQLLAVAPDNFEAHLNELAKAYRVVSLNKLLEEFQQGEFCPQTVALTFDDGYGDNLTHAVPLLEKYGLPATFFVTSGMIDSDREFWWDRLEHIFLANDLLPDHLEIHVDHRPRRWNLTTAADRLRAHDDLIRLLGAKPVTEINPFIDNLLSWAGLAPLGRPSHRVLNSSELHQLMASPGIEIGSHTVSHTRLSILSLKGQYAEIIESQKQLETLTGKLPRLFSYPFGSRSDFTPETTRLVAEAGLKAGIANIQGNIDQRPDFFAIPRRLVRNWPADIFARWLGDNDKVAYETESMALRSAKLIEKLDKRMAACQ